MIGQIYSLIIEITIPVYEVTNVMLKMCVPNTLVTCFEYTITPFILVTTFHPVEKNMYAHATGCLNGKNCRLQIPIPVGKIGTRQHPVKVGMSDAYIIETPEGHVEKTYLFHIKINKRFIAQYFTEEMVPCVSSHSKSGEKQQFCQ